MKRKILFIITHLELGGAQKQLFTLIKNLDINRYAFYLLSGDYGLLKENFLNIPYLKVYLIKELKREINIFYDLIAFFKIFFYIKKYKFDIIHTHSPKASFLGRWAAFFCGCKDIVYTVHGWPFHKFMPLVTYYFYLFLEKITSKITKKIIVVSNYDLREGIRKIAPKGKFVLIHYGIDTTPLEEIYEKRKERIQKDNLIITVSALKPQKGLDYFLNMAKDVLNEFPYIKFWIIGDGPLKKKIKRKIKRMYLENSVFLKGWVKDLSEAYQEATLFVLTSLWEGLPLAVIEAVICGIPILASNTGGLLDIVKEEKQGKIVDLKELPHFGRKCRKMLQNYTQWNKIVKSERKKIDVKYWGERRMLEEINKLYAEF